MRTEAFSGKIGVAKVRLVWPKGLGLGLGVDPQGMTVWLNVYSTAYSLELSILLNQALERFLASSEREERGSGQPVKCS